VLLEQCFPVKNVFIVQCFPVKKRVYSAVLNNEKTVDSEVPFRANVSRIVTFAILWECDYSPRTHVSAAM